MKKLVNEVDQVLGKYEDSKDVLEKYDIETSDEFEYLRQCFYESMRLESPAPVTSTNCFNKDVTIDGVNIPAG